MSTTLNFRINPAAHRAEMIQSLKALKTCPINSLEDITVQLLENNRVYFNHFDFDLVARVLSVTKRCRAEGQTHQKIDTLLTKIFSMIPEDGTPPPNEALGSVRDITQEEIRLEIAILCTNQNIWNVIHHVQEFGLHSESARLRLAKVCAEGAPESCAEFIQNFSLESEESRLQIAAICARANPFRTAFHIQNFHLKSEESRMHILTICLEMKSSNLPMHIHKFTIESEETRIHIAKVCAALNPESTAQYIQNFAITSEETRVHIANICIEQSVFGLAKFIRGFAIKRADVRLQIAIMCVEKVHCNAINYMEFFDILDEQDRFDIAIRCAKKNSEHTIYNIKNFTIHSEKARFEIAKVFLNMDADKTIKQIQKFAILDEADRFQFALLCMEKSPKVTAEYLHAFAIKNNQFKLQIALTYVGIDPPHMARYLNNFGLFRASRFQILQLLLGAAPEATIYDLKQHDFIDPQELSQALLVALHHNLETLKILDEHVENLPFRGSTIKALFEENPFLGQMNDLGDALEVRLNAYSQISHEVKDFLRKTIESFRMEEDLQMQQSLGRWLTGLLILMPASTASSFDWLKWFIPSLNPMRDPLLRWQLTGLLIDFDSQVEAHYSWQSLAENETWNLLAIPLFHLQKQGLEVNALKSIAHELVQKTKAKTPLFHDKINKRHLLATLCVLVKNRTLSAREKESVLQRIFYEDGQFLDEHTILKNLSALNNIHRLGQSRLLKYRRDLCQTFERAFLKVFPIQSHHENFLEAFNQRFANDHYLTSLMQYASCIKSLNDPAALDCLFNYIASILDGTVFHRRYRLESNPHLATLSESRPDLLAKWREPLRIELAISDAETTASALNPAKWLKMELDTHDHVKVPIDEFKKFLVASPEEKKQIMAKLGKNDTALRKKVRMSPSDHPEIKTLVSEQIRCKFLSICCKLFETKPNKSQEIQRQLKNLFHVVHYQEGYSEFQHHLKEMLNSLHAVHKTPTKAYAEVTDDPLSLLRSGSDVSGSCQRIDGDPQKNCGLLGYLVDGKIQMVAVKDVQGKILARCMLKILWNGSKPVLFRERMYPSLLSDEHKCMLNELAKKKAKILGLEIVSEDISENPYPHALQSLFSPAPFEYSDGGSNRVTKGIYTIHKTYLL